VNRSSNLLDATVLDFGVMAAQPLEGEKRGFESHLEFGTSKARYWFESSESTKMCEKCKKAELIIQEWADKQGHDRCWYYPDLFRKLAEVFEMDIQPGSLPSREEFEKGCLKYQNEEYSE